MGEPFLGIVERPKREGRILLKERNHLPFKLRPDLPVVPGAGRRVVLKPQNLPVEEDEKNVPLGCEEEEDDEEAQGDLHVGRKQVHLGLACDQPRAGLLQVGLVELRAAVVLLKVLRDSWREVARHWECSQDGWLGRGEEGGAVEDGEDLGSRAAAL